MKIIQVHGLGGRCERHLRSFTQQLTATLSFAADSDTISYDYPSSKTNFWSTIKENFITNPTNYSIEHISNSFGQFLKHELLLTTSHLLIISYSLGCIVTKRAIHTISSHISKDTQINIIFLGPPNEGSLTANLATHLNIGSAQTTQLNLSSTLLNDTDYHWNSLLSFDNIRAISIYGLRDIVVDIDTAFSEVEWTNRASYICPDLDHSTLIAPPDDHTMFRVIRSFFQKEHIERFSVCGERKSTFFDGKLIAKMETLNRTISTLTTEQYSCFDLLSKTRKFFVQGCAGTGKTLLAIEKAKRLADANFRVGFFCHSPLLASFVTDTLKEGNNVDVWYFNDFVHTVLVTPQEDTLHDYNDWSPYHEVTESEIENAFDNVIDELHWAYDAIVVDEGQEFSETALILIEALHHNPGQGLFYVFLDDRQRTVNKAVSITASEAPLLLRVNCRNAGNVYDIVRRFHPHAPNRSEFLKEQGECEIVRAPDFNAAIEAVIDRVQAWFSKSGPMYMVILTSEDCSLQESALSNQIIYYGNIIDWQETMLRASETIKRSAMATLKRKMSKIIVDIGKVEISKNLDALIDIAMPMLSEEPIPTSEDRDAIKAYATKVREVANFERRRSPEDLYWKHSRYRAILCTSINTMRMSRFRNKNEREAMERAAVGTRELDVEELLSVLVDGSWAEALKKPDTARIVPYYEKRKEDNAIPLYSVEQFKGLEADIVIGLIDRPRELLDELVYVAASRARYALTLVCTDVVARNIGKF